MKEENSVEFGTTYRNGKYYCAVITRVDGKAQNTTHGDVGFDTVEEAKKELLKLAATVEDALHTKGFDFKVRDSSGQNISEISNSLN